MDCIRNERTSLGKHHSRLLTSNSNKEPCQPSDCTNTKISLNSNVLEDIPLWLGPHTRRLSCRLGDGHTHAISLHEFATAGSRVSTPSWMFLYTKIKHRLKDISSKLKRGESIQPTNPKRYILQHVTWAWVSTRSWCIIPDMDVSMVGFYWPNE